MDTQKVTWPYRGKRERNNGIGKTRERVSSVYDSSAEVDDIGIYAMHGAPNYEYSKTQRYTAEIVNLGKNVEGDNVLEQYGSENLEEIPMMFVLEDMIITGPKDNLEETDINETLVCWIDKWILDVLLEEKDLDIYEELENEQVVVYAYKASKYNSASKIGNFGLIIPKNETYEEKSPEQLRLLERGGLKRLAQKLLKD